MKTPPDLSQLTPDQLRHLAATLMSQVEQQEQALAQSQKTLRHTEQVNQKLSYELALLKRHAFGKRSEQLNVLQISLLDEV
ncbi:transposase, partial [Halomonas beimenensis]